MIIRIAWKNIWRNPLRSILVMLSIIVGIWAGAFILSFIFAIMDNRLEDAIGYEISHVQIHHPDYLEDDEPQFTIPKSRDFINQLHQDSQVEAVSGRMIAYGMVASPRTSSGGKFIGIHPEDENKVTQLAGSIVEGSYFTEGSR